MFKHIHSFFSPWLLGSSYTVTQESGVSRSERETSLNVVHWVAALQSTNCFKTELVHCSTFQRLKQSSLY